MYIWKIQKKFLIRWHQWDDQYVVYHPGTGDTHLLEPIPFQILQKIVSKPSTQQDLINEVAHLSDNQQDIANEIRNLLVQWEQVGLIECEHISDPGAITSR